ncbi:MAG TPA: helix-turn-helix transcriptional regulator [Candidatus Avimonoglobus intestinipullorum]|uniref:Helix-turn-helix transcriptional regulator n=1 Tax=Candidatus Avimonoglobus intestinipullorum TaxID=2840699 RepID=A0A9D1LW17_9FIRM|nr:helix-turn-helix transcriptional regulator [Candidatus Avimonoglobus intestinipullorum]
MSKFSERLVFIRKKQNILQKDAVKALGISLRAYQYYETAEREPTMSILIKIAEYYNVSIDYLVGRTDNPTVNH